MRKGKKQKAKLQARINSYNKTITGDSTRITQFTAPGSLKKSH